MAPAKDKLLFVGKRISGSVVLAVVAHDRIPVFASNAALIHSLTEKAEQSNNNGREADNDPKGRRRRVTRDDPDDANGDYCERNKIGKQRVAHRTNPFRADADL